MLKKELLIAAATVLLSFAAEGKTDKEIPAEDARIEYTGRILKTGNGVQYDWSGVYARIRFEGTSLKIRCSDTHANWFNIWIDKEMEPQEDKRIFIHSEDTTVILAEGLKRGVHEIIFQKRTEGEQGTFTLHSVIPDKELVAAHGKKDRHIEFIGDSYTCGYGVEDVKESHFSPTTENCNLTYAAIISRYFNADYNLISHSGQGIARNYDDYRPGYNMVERYDQTFDEHELPKWDASAANYRPNAVVIYLCTNDFSTERQPSLNTFTDKYIRLLEKVRRNYGEEVPVLCVASRCDDMAFDYIRHAVKKSKMKNISYVGLTWCIHDNNSELGSDWHPNYRGHLKVAMSLIPYLSTITGWPLKGEF